MFFSTCRDGAGVLPGSSLGGFVIESRLKPGVRVAEMTPSRRVEETSFAHIPNGSSIRLPTAAKPH